MSPEEIVARVFQLFADDLQQPPPLTLRGANAIDSHDWPTPFEASADLVTDSYLEGFAFWGLAYLDAQSWRHYLPALIKYALGRPDDPAMVAEALVRSLRPPDHSPARLASLTPAQEAAVTAFLEHVARVAGPGGLSADATDALDEWWRPGARSRPTPEAIAAARAEPVRYRHHVDASFRLDLPDTLAGSGARTIPEEARRVEVLDHLDQRRRRRQAGDRSRPGIDAGGYRSSDARGATRLDAGTDRANRRAQVRHFPVDRQHCPQRRRAQERGQSIRQRHMARGRHGQDGTGHRFDGRRRSALPRPRSARVTRRRRVGDAIHSEVCAKPQLHDDRRTGRRVDERGVRLGVKVAAARIGSS